MSDITVIYYTANKISAHFAENTLRHLLASVGDLPLISVSQAPMTLGENICVGDIGVSTRNIYRQALIGAQRATTTYIGMAEDDTLYSPEHFHHTPTPGMFAYNRNTQAIFTWTKPPTFSAKVPPRRNFCNLICERALFIEAMEERFAKYPRDEDCPQPVERFWGEPGRLERNLGVTVRTTEDFVTDIPNVQFAHPEAFGFGHLGTRRKLGDVRTTELPHWGTAAKIVELYKAPVE